jgi:GlcNAc-P-P-Und epimerase
MHNMAKTLITGGSGFIGSHFHHVISNSELVNLDLEKPTFKHSATFYQGDIRKKEDVTKVFEREKEISRIISLAAKHHDFGIGHDEYFDTNEMGTQVLCEVATRFNINEIVFYSSVAVYGTTNEMSDESLEPAPDSPYGASKLAGENVLRKWAAEQSGRKVLIIRPALVFGANNVANMYKLIKQIDLGVYFHIGKGDNIKSIAYVENLVKATLFLADKMPNGVSTYNYADEPQLTSREIGNTIATALGKKVRLTVPLSAAVILGLPFDLLIKITGKNFPISTARIKKLNTQTLHSARKMAAAGFKPDYTTKQGLGKMVAWYKSGKSE